MDGTADRNRDGRSTPVKLRIATGTLVLVLLNAVFPGRASAAPAHIPVRMYPTGAHVTYLPTVNNETMDCMWSFFCEGGIPVFHRNTVRR
jgi:hypothetical protein